MTLPPVTLRTLCSKEGAPGRAGVAPQDAKPASFAGVLVSLPPASRLALRARGTAQKVLVKITMIQGREGPTVVP
jgi:hypothetical protein